MSIVRSDAFQSIYIGIYRWAYLGRSTAHRGWWQLFTLYSKWAHSIEFPSFRSFVCWCVLVFVREWFSNIEGVNCSFIYMVTWLRSTHFTISIFDEREETLQLSAISTLSQTHTHAKLILDSAPSVVRASNLSRPINAIDTFLCRNFCGWVYGPWSVLKLNHIFH